MKTGLSVLATASWLILSISSTFAGSATWLSNPVSGDWNTASNWTSGGPPNGPTDTATFDFSAVATLSAGGNTDAGAIVFNSGGSLSYTISVSSMEIYGSGIINNSGLIQNFVTGLAPHREILFTNNASAGSNTVFTLGGAAAEGGSAYFFRHSNAGNATFTINGSNHQGWGGSVSFYDNSSAGNATIIVNGSAFQQCPPPGDHCFDNPAPAGLLLLATTRTRVTPRSSPTGDRRRRWRLDLV